jgi:hypothetical protein
LAIERSRWRTFCSDIARQHLRRGIGIVGTHIREDDLLTDTYAPCVGLTDLTRADDDDYLWHISLLRK